MLSYIKNYLEKSKTDKNIRWTDEILEPLSKEISKKLNCNYFVGMPSGLRADVNIFFKKDEDYIGKITITPYDLRKGILHYDTGAKKKDCDEFDKLHRLNNVTAELPQDVNEIIKIVLNSIK